MKRRSSQRSKLADWLILFERLLGSLIVGASMLLAFVGATGHLKDDFPDVSPNTWLSVAGTLMAATAASGVAMFVLVHQQRAQDRRDRQNRVDADERDRRAREVTAAAELSAELAQAWPLAASTDEFWKTLHQHEHQPGSALADLHRLTAVWINWTEDALWPAAGIHPQQLLTATNRSGIVLRRAALDRENIAARQFFGPMLTDSHQAEIDQIVAAHNYLERLAQDVVLMPLWPLGDRADTIRDLYAAGKLVDKLPVLSEERQNTQ